jgi:methylmalonyl-CoA mutase
MSKSLFNEFESVSSKAWKQKIQVDLKGADYNDTLIWKTYDGIDVKPFYHADQFEDFPDISNTQVTQWKVCETINVTDCKAANAKAHDVLKRGAESIHFSLNTATVDIDQLLKDIDTNLTPIDLSYNTFSQKELDDLLNLDKASFLEMYVHSIVLDT